MNSTELDQLRSLSKIEKRVEAKFTNDVLEKQGLEQHIEKMYKPITEAQKLATAAVEVASKTSTDLLTKIHETPLMSEIMDIVMRYPDVVSTIVNPDNIGDLNNHEVAIYNKAKSLPKSKFELLREYVLLEMKRQAEAAVEAEAHAEADAEGISRETPGISGEPAAESTPITPQRKKRQRKEEKEIDYIVSPEGELVEKSSYIITPEDEAIGDAETSTKEGDSDVINNLYWGSQKYTNALFKSDSRNIDSAKASRFGLAYRVAPDINMLALGFTALTSDTDNKIITQNNNIHSPNVWELLTKEQLQAPGAIGRFKYTDVEISDYLKLLHEGKIRIDTKLQKARIIGEYIKEYGVDHIKQMGAYDKDVDYYTKLVKSGKGCSSVSKPFTSKAFMNKDELWHDLTRLIASYRAGNTAVYNQINDIVDTLRRNGVIGLEESKKIYRSLTN